MITNNPHLKLIIKLNSFYNHFYFIILTKINDFFLPGSSQSSHQRVIFELQDLLIYIIFMTNVTLNLEKTFLVSLYQQNARNCNHETSKLALSFVT